MIGRQLGPYAIIAPLGAGGMGEVYRARDSKLGRDVAIKILPSHFTTTLSGSRFAREARLLATLNHPHIGAIYGLEETDGVTALVLELVEGPTLADRLTRGPLPIPEALVIAPRSPRRSTRHIRRGSSIAISSRPTSCCKARQTGRRTKCERRWSTSAWPRRSRLGRPERRALHPPESLDGTADGRILGTAAYMSPQQARGQGVDKRADIWAFGCVFFEMLTGKQPFDGETVSDTLARILEREPDWTTLPAATPQPIHKLLRRCLEKDPARRVRHR